MTGSGLELTRQRGAGAAWGSSAKPIAWLQRSPSFPAEPASFLKLLVEKGKATDHGAALVPWAGSTFARHNPAGPMEETSMS